MKHPIQAIIKDPQGVLRYQENTIVSHMLKKLKSLGYDLNDLHVDCHTHSSGDWDQFNQLHGYSVSGHPGSNELHDIAMKMHEDGKSELQTRAEVAEEKLESLKKSLRGPIADLYNICAEDLEEH